MIAGWLVLAPGSWTWAVGPSTSSAPGTSPPASPRPPAWPPASPSPPGDAPRPVDGRGRSVTWPAARPGLETVDPMPPARPRARKAPSRTAPSRSRRPPSRRPPVPSKPRSFLWRWRRGLFLVGLLLVAFVAGTGFVLAQIELPPARFQAQTTFICARRRHRRAGLQRGQRHGAPLRRAGSRRRHPRAGARGPRPGRARRRGPRLLRAPRRRPRRHRPGRVAGHPRRHGLPGRLDDHPAVREDRLPLERADDHPQDQGGGARHQARAGALQGGDPRALPQRHLLRARQPTASAPPPAPTSATTSARSTSPRPPTSPG